MMTMMLPTTNGRSGRSLEGGDGVVAASSDKSDLEKNGSRDGNGDGRSGCGPHDQDYGLLSPPNKQPPDREKDRRWPEAPSPVKGAQEETISVGWAVTLVLSIVFVLLVQAGVWWAWLIGFGSEHGVSTFHAYCPFFHFFLAFLSFIVFP